LKKPKFAPIGHDAGASTGRLRFNKISAKKDRLGRRAAAYIGKPRFPAALGDPGFSKNISRRRRNSSRKK